MDDICEVTGKYKTDYPKICESIEKIGTSYGFKHLGLKVNKSRSSGNKNTMKGRSILGKRLIFSVKTANFVEGLAKDEIDSVIAHELSHVYHRDEHITTPLVVLFAVPLLVFFISSYVNKSAINFDYILQLIVCSMLFIFGLRVAFSRSRYNEFRADMSAVMKTGKGESLKRTLTKIALFYMGDEKPNLATDVANIVFEIIFYITGDSHPSISERFNNIDFVSNHLLMVKEEKLIIAIQK